MAGNAKTPGKERRVSFAAMLVAALLLAALLAGFASTRAIRVPLPHTGEYATLFATEKTENGPSFSVKAENLDKTGREISYEMWGYHSSGGGYRETVTRFEDSSVGYIFNETEGKASIRREYTCLTSGCGAPYERQEYLYANGGSGERLTTCFFGGDYEMTVNRPGTTEYSTAMGKGCPIE